MSSEWFCTVFGKGKGKGIYAQYQFDSQFKFPLRSALSVFVAEKKATGKSYPSLPLPLFVIPVITPNIVGL